MSQVTANFQMRPRIFRSDYGSDMGLVSGRCHGVFLISWHFQIWEKNLADESPILGVLNPICCSSCLSICHSWEKKLPGKLRGKGSVDSHSVVIFIIRPWPLLHGDSSYLFLCLVCLFEKLKIIVLDTTLIERALFVWWTENTSRAWILWTCLIIRGQRVT